LRDARGIDSVSRHAMRATPDRETAAGMLTHESRRIWIGRALLILVTGWALAMVVGDFARVFHRLGSPGFFANNDGLIYDVRGPFADERLSPAWKAGVRPGDRIDIHRMRCVTLSEAACADLLAVLGGMQYVEPGRHLVLAVAKGGAGESVQLELVAEVPAERWAGRSILLLDEVVGVAFVLAAAWLVWTRPGQMSWGFFLYAIWFNPGQSYAFYIWLERWPHALLAQWVLEAIAQGLGYAGFLAFAMRAPSGEITPRWRAVERWLPLVAGGMTVLQLAGLGAAFGINSERITQLGYLAGYVVSLAALAILLLRRREQTPLDLQRMRWLIAGCVIGLPAFILAEIMQSTTLLHTAGFDPSGDLVGLLYLVNGVLGYFVFEAIRRRRVVGVSVPLRRITLLGLLFSAPLGYMRQVLESLHDDLGVAGWVWLVVLGVGLFALNRAHDALTRLADHTYNRVFRRELHEMDALGHRVLAAASVAELERMLVDEPLRILRLASAAVFTPGAAGFERTCAAGWGDNAVRVLDPRVDAALIPAALGGDAFQVRLSAIDQSRFPEDAGAPNLAVPIGDRIRCYAIGVYGSHENGMDLDSDERAMLSRMARDAAAAYAQIEAEGLRAQLRALEAKARVEV